jgi:hypothetical protein
MHSVAGSTTARSRRLDVMLHSRRVQYIAVFSCVQNGRMLGRSCVLEVLIMMPFHVKET